MSFFFEKYDLALSAETTKKVQVFANREWGESTQCLKYISANKDGLIAVYEVEIFCAPGSQ